MNSDKPEQNNQDRKYIIIAIIVGVIIICLWVINLLVLKNLEPDVRGTYGDMFGVINSLFSGLALAGIILTILLQRNELALQREELKQTRKEFQIQNITLKLQRFENTFFNMLSLHNQIANSLEYKENVLAPGGAFSTVEITINGRDIFKKIYMRLLNKIKNVKDINEFDRKYLEYWSFIRNNMDHYFRNLYRIIKFVNSSSHVFGDEYSEYDYLHRKKYNYTSIIRDQLTEFEVLWLFYYCISPSGKKLKPLVEEYTLLKNLQERGLSNHNLMHKFKKSAYYHK